MNFEIKPNIEETSIEILKNQNGSFDLVEADFCEKIFNEIGYVGDTDLSANVDAEIDYQTHSYAEFRKKKTQFFLSRVQKKNVSEIEDNSTEKHLSSLIDNLTLEEHRKTEFVTKSGLLKSLFKIAYSTFSDTDSVGVYRKANKYFVFERNFESDKNMDVRYNYSGHNFENLITKKRWWF